MYRIMLARSGYYYVQEQAWSHRGDAWFRVGGFFKSRGAARAFVQGRRNEMMSVARNRVVEYL